MASGDIYVNNAGAYSKVGNILGSGAYATQWREGIGTPSNSLGSNGDFYLDTTPASSTLAGISGTTGTFTGAVSAAGLLTAAAGVSATTGVFNGNLTVSTGGATITGGCTITGGVIANGSAGQIRAQSDGATLAYCPPVYTAAGAITAATQHIVQGYATTSTNGFVTVNLSGAAAFSGTYFIMATVMSGSNPGSIYNVYTNPTSGSAFSILCTNNATSTGISGVNIQYIAIGY